MRARREDHYDTVQVGLAQWLEGPIAAELFEVPVNIAGSY